LVVEPIKASPALLRELEALIAGLDDLLLAKLRPGLSRSQVQAIERRHGLGLPAEARDWWEWHDGSTGEVLPGVSPFSLEQAVAGNREQREMFARAADDSLAGWHVAWLPVLETGAGFDLLLDCSVGFEEPCPVLQYERFGGEVYVAYPSLGTCLVDILRAGWHGKN
jgi:cell wall assembly regulator SMI1